MGMNQRLLRPLATGFDPRRIAGLALWLDAADSATLGPTDAGPGAVSENGPVKYWGDKSGNGRHATTSAADGNSPSYLPTGANNLPALGFDGDDLLDGSWPVTLTEQTTFAVRMQVSGAASNGARIWTQSDSGSDTASGGYVPLLRVQLTDTFASFADSNFRAEVAITEDVLSVLMSQHTGSQIQNRLNNGAAVTFNSTLNRTFTRYRIGSNFATPFIGGRESGRIAEVVIYSRSLSASERDGVARYLGRKWGVAVS